MGSALGIPAALVPASGGGGAAPVAASDYGSYNWALNAVETVTIGPGTLIKAEGVSVDGLLSANFTTPGNNRLTYGGATTTKFAVSVVASFQGVVNDKECRIALVKNAPAGAEAEQIVGNSHPDKPGVLGIEAIVELATGDFLEVFIANDEEVTNLIVSFLNVVIISAEGTAGATGAAGAPGAPGAPGTPGTNGTDGAAGPSGGLVFDWGAAFATFGRSAVADGAANAPENVLLDEVSEIVVPDSIVLKTLTWNSASSDATTVIEILKDGVVVETVALTGAAGTDDTLTAAFAAGDKIAIRYAAGTTPDDSNWHLFSAPGATGTIPATQGRRTTVQPLINGAGFVDVPFDAVDVQTDSDVIELVATSVNITVKETDTYRISYAFWVQIAHATISSGVNFLARVTKNGVSAALPGSEQEDGERTSGSDPYGQNPTLANTFLVDLVAGDTLQLQINTLLVFGTFPTTADADGIHMTVEKANGAIGPRGPTGPAGAGGATLKDVYVVNTPSAYGAFTATIGGVAVTQMYGFATTFGIFFGSTLGAQGLEALYVTSAVLGSDAGIALPSGSIHRRDLDSCMRVKLELQDILDVRFFAGMTETFFTMLASDAPFLAYAGVQFSTPRGDGFYQFVVGDGVGGQTIVASTVVPVATVPIMVEVRCDESGPEILVIIRDAKSDIILDSNLFTAVDAIPPGADGMLDMAGVETQAALGKGIAIFYGSGINRA